MESAAGDVLIVSTFGDGVSGGGLFALDGSRVERVDRIATTGLAFDGKRLARSFRCPGSAGPVGELAIYDERGVRRYLRVDEAAAVHDVAWDGEDVVLVSTWHNAVLWASPAGEIVREVRYPGPSDSWHVNCVTRRDGVWYATVFGGFSTFRGWAGPASEGAGRIVELGSGKTVVDGLSAPHSPRWIDGMWLVCNSEKNELLAVDDGSGRVVRRVPCGDWTRGLAHDDDFFYVGTCQRRATQESFGDARIVVVDRRTWEPVERIALPAQEIYDLVWVPRALHAGLLRGFDVNPYRSAELRQYRILDELGVQAPRSLWPTGDPLPWTDFRCEVRCTMPAACAAGELVELPLRVTNRSASFFTSAPPAPVYASYKWLDPETGEYVADGRAYRTPLPRTIFPGETVEMTALVIAPPRAGAALARITLIQEGVSWFDDQHPSNAVEFLVDVAPAERAEPSDVAPVVR